MADFLSALSRSEEEETLMMLHGRRDTIYVNTVSQRTRRCRREGGEIYFLPFTLLLEGARISPEGVADIVLVRFGFSGNHSIFGTSAGSL